MRNSEKHGVSGQSKAKTAPYRLVGGSHDRPRLSGMTSLAMTVQKNGYDQSATYHRGMIGGLMASRLGFPFPGSDVLETSVQEAA